IVLSMEPMEALRQMPYLGAKGVLVSNTVSICNIEQYPEQEELLAELRRAPEHLLIDADSMAKEAGSSRAANMVLLGALANCLDLDKDLLSSSMAQFFASKGDKVLQSNLAAFQAGAACHASKQ
ncbi:MAG: indolepyruvate oxidoreductase, partial [Oligosphaeraceae bacterium]|nr:indolepyruvate oxidoreductase [Oligosphaeraceae bacterium]